MLDLSHEPDLGYIFYPYEVKNHPGHPRLDIVLQEIPTERHFDPQQAHFKGISSNGCIEQITIHHPWPLAARYRVCAGRIILKDRRGKLVEAFSFGGDLQIRSDIGCTVCGLISTAPIFPLFTTHDLPMWITAEVEVILARQNAHWDPRHPYDYEAHLARMDPFLLYASSLQTLQDQAAAHTYLEVGELDHQGEHFVRAEIQRLKEKGVWPERLPTPDQLFSSDLAALPKFH